MNGIRHDEEKFMRYLLSNLHMEQELWQRQVKLNNEGPRICKYFNSTPTKRMLSRYLVEARVDVKALYTIASFAKVMGVSRQAINSIIDETIAEGWTEDFYKNKTRYFRATIYHFEIHKQYLNTLTEMRIKYVTDYCASLKMMGNV